MIQYNVKMTRIERKNHYVFLVEGDRKGFETYYNLGKDPNDEFWADEIKEINAKKDDNQ